MKFLKNVKTDEFMATVTRTASKYAEIAERNKTITAGKEAVERSMANQNGEV